jgi:hypothetical protein
MSIIVLINSWVLLKIIKYLDNKKLGLFNKVVGYTKTKGV